jgi:hypothetical protein
LSGVITASTREVLENYSKIPPAEVDPHIYAVVCRLRHRLLMSISDAHGSATKPSPSILIHASAKVDSSSLPLGLTSSIPRFSNA